MRGLNSGLNFDSSLLIHNIVGLVFWGVSNSPKKLTTDIFIVFDDFDVDINIGVEFSLTKDVLSHWFRLLNKNVRKIKETRTNVASVSKHFEMLENT